MAGQYDRMAEGLCCHRQCTTDLFSTSLNIKHVCPCSIYVEYDFHVFDATQAMEIQHARVMTLFNQVLLHGHPVRHKNHNVFDKDPEEDSPAIQALYMKKQISGGLDGFFKTSHSVRTAAVLGALVVVRFT